MGIQDGTWSNWGKPFIQAADQFIKDSDKAETFCEKALLNFKGRSFYWLGGSAQIVPAAMNCKLCLFDQTEIPDGYDLPGWEKFQEITDSRKWKALKSSLYCVSSYWSVLNPHGLI